MPQGESWPRIGRIPQSTRATGLLGGALAMQSRNFKAQGDSCRLGGFYLKYVCAQHYFPRFHPITSSRG